MRHKYWVGIPFVLVVVQLAMAIATTDVKIYNYKNGPIEVELLEVQKFTPREWVSLGMVQARHSRVFTNVPVRARLRINGKTYVVGSADKSGYFEIRVP